MIFEKVAEEDFPRGVALPVPRIAVIGCGPSGLAMTIALMKRLHRPFDAWMIDASEAPGAFGDGLAGEALMCEPAGDLSVTPDRQDDFVDWLRDGMLGDGSVAVLRGPQGLHVRRSLFRDYVMARFADALAARKDVGIRTFRGGVRRVEPAGGGAGVVFADGERVSFDHVFLATGCGTARRESDSWQAAEAALEQARADAPPLTLLGSGPRLAAVLLHLRSAGYAGEIRIAAPGGWLPLQPHARGHDMAVFGEAPAGRSLLQAFRYVRRECAAAGERTGGQWQSVVDAASARLCAVWRNLPQAERNRYRRRLLRLHRAFSVRIAPDLHHRLLAELARPETVVLPAGGTASCPEPLCTGERVIDCRDAPSAGSLEALFSLEAGALSVDEGGSLTLNDARVPGVSIIGAAASCLRPGPFVFAETVRQAYRAALDTQPDDLARVLRR